MKCPSWLNKFLRWVFRTHKKEIKRFVDEKIDEGLKELHKHVNKPVIKKIRKEIIRAIDTNNINIYTQVGVENVKFFVNEFIEKLGGGD